MSGIISVEQHYGTVNITGNTVDKCTGQAPAKFVNIKGANTGKVFIGPNILRGRAGSNMTVGYEIDATVPAGAVTFAAGTYFGESITTKWSLGAAVSFPVDLCHQFEEVTDQAAPAANQCRIYARDTGGKTELVARFPTGAIQRLAIEP